MNHLTCLMAASLLGPLGGELAGAEGWGVSDGLSPVLCGRGAGIVGAGAIALQPPGTRGGRRQRVYKRYKPSWTTLIPQTERVGWGESCCA